MLEISTLEFTGIFREAENFRCNDLLDARTKRSFLAKGNPGDIAELNPLVLDNL